MDDELIEKVMTRHPITVTGKTSVASAGHSMIWEGIDLLPVVSDAGLLAGIISRQDVLKHFKWPSVNPNKGKRLMILLKIK